MSTTSTTRAPERPHISDAKAELASKLYRVSRDLAYMAADIEAAVDRLAGEGGTDAALAAAALIRRASDACDLASGSAPGDLVAFLHHLAYDLKMSCERLDDMTDRMPGRLGDLFDLLRLANRAAIEAATELAGEVCDE
ncbi:hypothetical protein MIN45_P0869 [Methylomarinovum tepidoasis]|uniref:Uncharacterized protein n=1 Tax=Methylomarinovum tepidoasis TaxID=2840183 RepID=A0AAU9C7U6_9GAMM|nr:hypothetical protein [Methylomarinovum sp. IN45]BCX88500.1 hypothetical protein MIN45_P0869 [Methylomarinovum sp. IN45]